MNENPSHIVHRRRKHLREDIADKLESLPDSEESQGSRGQPIMIDESGPDWYITRSLKEQGFTHPLLERTKDLDAARDEADAAIRRVERRRARLQEFGRDLTLRQVDNFNLERSYALKRYREEIEILNREIRDYNLTVPTALQRPHINIERVLRETAERVPPLEPPAREPIQARQRSWLGRRLASLQRRPPFSG